MIGGVEAGGTTFRCAIANDPLDIVEELTIATTTPVETLQRVVEFFACKRNLDRIGIASFGPICLDASDARYGTILETPKPGWRGTDILGVMTQRLNVTCEIDTDVAAALLAEHRHGAASGTDVSVYITIGTGIGAATLAHGRKPTSRFHEEMGHMLVPRHPDDTATSVCIHANCLEGLASATAIERHWGSPAHAIAADHRCWDIEAYYLAVFCVNVTRILAPDVILFGGGIARAPHLIERVRQAFQTLMNDYHTVGVLELNKLIQYASLEPNAGLIGALCLAAAASR